MQMPTTASAPTPRPPLVKGLETGLMPSMDEGAFIFDYWAPSGTPLERTEQMARQVEEILSKHPELTPFQLKNVLYLTANNVGGGR